MIPPLKIKGVNNSTIIIIARGFLELITPLINSILGSGGVNNSQNQGVIP